MTVRPCLRLLAAEARLLGVRVRGRVIWALAAVLAGCAPAKPAPIADGAWAFDKVGDEARLIYKRAGKPGPELTCEEGSEEVTLRAVAPAPAEGRPDRLSLSAGTRGQVDLTLPASRAEDGRVREYFVLGDSLLSAFLGSGRLKVADDEVVPATDLRSPQAVADQNAIWRFRATCRAGERLSVITGDPPPASLYALMSGLDVAHAADDARRALARGDKRFVAITGYSIEAPGSEQRLDRRKEWRVVDPTHDRYWSKEHGQLKDNARAYALAYNAVILAATKGR